MTNSKSDLDDAKARREMIRATPKGERKRIMKGLNKLIAKTEYIMKQAEEHNARVAQEATETED